MFFNKNGLKVNLNFDHPLNENEISKLEEVKTNKNIIRKESFIYFSQTSKSISIEEKKNVNKFLRKHSYNFPIISKIKMNKEYIINKTLKFQILKSNNKLPKTCKSLEIIKINDINIFRPKKIIETENNNNITAEKEDKSIKEKKLFLNLNRFNINNIFIKGKEKHKYIIMDVQSKISDIEFKGELKKKAFELLNISSKINDIIIKQEFHKKVFLEPFKAENIEIKPNLKTKISKENISDIDFKNVISFQISGISKLNEEKNKENIISVQSNIINFEIINKAKNIFRNLFDKRIINFEIRTKKKKKRKNSPHLVLKKVEGFNNINNKPIITELNNKVIQFHENEKYNINLDEKSENKNKEKIDKFKTKSPNHIQIKVKNNNNQDINFNINDNKNNNINKLKINKIISSNKESKNGITINTINNEIIYNKQTFDFPIINTDILHFEEQYEKIKKDLNELYPIFNRNKKYRENFFIQLSQGNKDKYNFYLDLYDIIKDEQEEKNNNHFKNYLKLKKIIKNKNINIQNNKLAKNKLRPLKKNKSSHYIFAKDKIKPLFTDL